MGTALFLGSMIVAMVILICSEIADIFDRVNEQSCFDAASLITQFDNFQNCYPEEMWRLDIQRKYIRTFTGRSYDNSKLADNDGNTKQNTRFLKEMMQKSPSFIDIKSKKIMTYIDVFE